MGHPWPLFGLFSSFVQTNISIFKTNECGKVHPVLGFEPTTFKTRVSSHYQGSRPFYEHSCLKRPLHDFLTMSQPNEICMSCCILNFYITANYDQTSTNYFFKEADKADPVAIHLFKNEFCTSVRPQPLWGLSFEDNIVKCFCPARVDR